MKILSAIVVAALLGLAGSYGQEKHQHAGGPALAELKQSAGTGSELVMKNNFKDFDKALHELEQQMKKQ